SCFAWSGWEPKSGRVLVDDHMLGGEYCHAGPRPLPFPSRASCSARRLMARFAARRTRTLLKGGMVLDVVTMPSLSVLSTRAVTLEFPRSAARFLTGRLSSSA